jgi:hypothetical protein
MITSVSVHVSGVLSEYKVSGYQRSHPSNQTVYVLCVTQYSFHCCSVRPTSSVSKLCQTELRIQDITDVLLTDTE